ncbi:putative uncharacterized protein DDB_G0289263 [Acyrthosiphon pisum]|uniref:Uncharacterized protein n=1 Tax=Acyrthosiphon pisum TaxID=7029 RepID=A0A8R2H5N3_ACYPI|nr:putative uncharacterized protein DDB_G0289263 [Acyrthosiphon pisum]|eukprot:XP_016659845.1 PREDICTED: putative uncharacterized protein DDB_G0289263 [Acyrthosiphon pisum]
MDRDIKKIQSVINQKEQSIVPLNLKISKEVSITSITNVNDTENSIILNKLKKLPGITINLVKTEPVFKVPESPRLKNNNKKKNITSHNKLKVSFEKKGLSERRDDNIEAMDNNCLTYNIINISNTNLNQGKTVKQKQIFNNMSLMTKSSDQGILKNPEASLKKYPVLEKENVQRTSSPKKLPKKVQSISKIKSKSLKTIKPGEVSNNCDIFSKEVKKVSDKDTIINNAKFKTNELANGSYRLMDLSTDGQFNIVPASFPSNFNNVHVPEYNNFLMGIGKSSEDYNMHLETSQNDTENGSLIIKEELDHFSDFLGCVNTSLNINKSNDIHSELASESFNNGISSLDNIKDEQLYINNKSKENINGKFEDEQKHTSNFYFYNHTSKQLPLQHNNMNQTMDTYIKQEDKQLLENDNLLSFNISNTENNLMEFNTSIPQILPINTHKNSSNLKSNENENGIKRKQTQNELHEKLKKQKLS